LVEATGLFEERLGDADAVIRASEIKDLTCDDVHNNYYKSPNYEQLRATIRKYDLSLIPLHEERGQKVNLSARSHSIIVSQTLIGANNLGKRRFSSVFFALNSLRKRRTK
jgi:hypothetical protein